MKRIFLLSILGLSLTACSVDQDELDFNENEIQELNAMVNTTECEPEIQNFGEAGSIEVTNDENTLYIKVLPEPGYDLVNTKLHIANSVDDFPTVGSGTGNLPPGQMDFKVNNPAPEGHTFEFDLDDYPESFFIASHSTFSKDGTSHSAWAGTPVEDKGKWAYFEYTVQECEVECTEFLGPDNTSNVLTQAEVFGWDIEDVKKYVDENLLVGLPEGGTFDPTLEEMFEPFFTGGVAQGSFQSTYTVTVGDCEDSIIIGGNVVP